jgi:hypothetical protein
MESNVPKIPSGGQVMTTQLKSAHTHVSIIEADTSLKTIRRSITRLGVLVIGHNVGTVVLRNCFEAAISKIRSSKDIPDMVLFHNKVRPHAAASFRIIFEDKVATGDEFDFLPVRDLVNALRSHDSDDRAVGVSYSSETGVITFITGDVKRLIVPTSSMAIHDVMGKPDFDAISLTDGGHTVTFGGDYEVAFDGLRYAYDPAYRTVVRKRARDKDRSFGGCLRRARFHKGLGQADFGNAERTIRRIENGTDPQHRIGQKVLQLIERKLGMSLAEIKTY